MSPDATLDPRQRYDALAAALSTRKSTLHFAHAGVSLVATIIFTGTSARLFWKGDADDAVLGAVAGAIAGGLFVYSLARLLVGRARLKHELVDFAQLQALRRQLGLDDPGRMMP